MKQDQFMYTYLQKLTDSLNNKHNVHKDEVDRKIERDIKSIRDEISKIKPIEKEKEPNEDMSIMMFKILDKMKQYAIKDGKWHYEGKDTGVKAEAKDGTNGLNGKNGADGYTPIKNKDYFDGKNGIDGINRA